LDFARRPIGSGNISACHIAMAILEEAGRSLLAGRARRQVEKHREALL
jgi:hypothetical protein